MRRPIQQTVTRIRGLAKSVHNLFQPKPRDLQGELKKQSTENYWRERQKASSRRLRILSYRYRLDSLTDSVWRNFGFVRNALPEVDSVIIQETVVERCIKDLFAQEL